MIIRGKIEVMNDRCSQTFARKLEQYLSIYCCSQNPSKISKSNGCEGMYYLQKKKFLRGGIAMQPEPSKKELHRSHFEELAF